MNVDETVLITLLRDIRLNLYRCAVCTLLIVGNLGNLTNSLIFWKKSWRKNVSVFYFQIANLHSTTYINSAMLGSIFINGYGINLMHESSFICKIYTYVAFLSATLYPTTLILASIDRLLISSQNVDTRLYSSKRLAYVLVSINTVAWTIFFIHVLVMMKIQQFDATLFLCYYDLSPSYLHFVSFSSLALNILFSSTLILLSIIASKNVRQIRAVPRRDRQQIRAMTRKDFQLLRCLYVQGIVYSLMSIFICAHLVYNTATSNQQKTYLRTTVEDLTYSFTALLLDIAFCSNFFIYLAASKAFRNEIKRIVYQIIGKNLNGTRDDDNKLPTIENNNVELQVVNSIDLG